MSARGGALGAQHSGPTRRTRNIFADGSFDATSLRSRKTSIGRKARLHEKSTRISISSLVSTIYLAAATGNQMTGPVGRRKMLVQDQMFGSRSKYSSSSLEQRSPSPINFSDAMNSIRSIHLIIL